MPIYGEARTQLAGHSRSQDAHSRSRRAATRLRSPRHHWMHNSDTQIAAIASIHSVLSSDNQIETSVASALQDSRTEHRAPRVFTQGERLSG